MSTKAQYEKAKRRPKYKTRARSRCAICGRGKGYMRKFGICRICFRELASKSLIPGIKKASW